MTSLRNKIIIYSLIVGVSSLLVGKTSALTQSSGVGVTVSIPAFSPGPSSGGGGGGGGGSPSSGGGSQTPGDNTAPPSTVEPTPEPGETTPPSNTENPPAIQPPPTDNSSSQTPPPLVPNQQTEDTPNNQSSTPVFITIEPSGATTENFVIGNSQATLPTFTGAITFQGETNLLLSNIVLQITGPKNTTAQITSTSSGNWSWNSNEYFPEGTYSITVKISDSSLEAMTGGNSLTFAVKGTVPDTEIEKQLEELLELSVLPIKLPKIITDIRDNPIVIQTIKQITEPASQAAIIISGGGVAIATTAANAGIAATIEHIAHAVSNLRFYLLGLFRFKKRKSWGRALYKHTGEPAAGATVQVYDAEFNKLKDSQITDRLGRFSALVAPGIYYVKIFKPGFKVARSGNLNITPQNDTLHLELVLEPLEDTVLGTYARGISLWTHIKQLLVTLNPYILAIGTIISIINAIVIPTVTNQVILAVYIAIDAFQFYLLSTAANPYGSITDEQGKPLPLSIVRIFNTDRQILMATKVTDEQGRFNFLVNPGNYFVTVTRPGFIPHTSEQISIPKANILKLHITLHPNITKPQSI